MDRSKFGNSNGPFPYNFRMPTSKIQNSGRENMPFISFRDKQINMRGENFFYFCRIPRRVFISTRDIRAGRDKGKSAALKKGLDKGMGGYANCQRLFPGDFR